MTKKVFIFADEAKTQILGMTFTFDDGSTQEFDGTQVNAATKERAAWHGFSQKIGDSYASAGGSSDPVAFAKAAVADTIKQLYAGEWRAASTSGPKTTDLAVALSRLTGKTVEESQAFVETLDDANKKVWRGKAKVKAMLATIAAERAIEKAKKLGASTTADEAVSF